MEQPFTWPTIRLPPLGIAWNHRPAATCHSIRTWHGLGYRPVPVVPGVLNAAGKSGMLKTSLRYSPV